MPEGFRDMKYFANSNIMDVDFAPEHLIIVGGSYIGLEFGQMYRRFGNKVTIIEKGSRLIHREDEDVSEEIKKNLEAEGINLHFNANCLSGEMDGDKIKVNVDCKEGDPLLNSYPLHWRS
ncbi:hypothetical protein MASR2M41_00280 [Flammeovirgaceae bacterium]